MNVPWGQYSESEMANMAAHDSVAARRLDMRYQEEDQLRGVNGYGSRSVPSSNVGGTLALWFLAALAAGSLVGVYGWWQLTVALVPQVRSFLEGSPLDGFLASSEGGPDGQPIVTGLVVGALWLIPVIGLTFVKKRWRQYWLNSYSGHWHLVAVAWLLTLARTLVFFGGAAVAVAAGGVAHGVDLAAGFSEPAYPGNGFFLFAMVLPAVLVSYPFVTSTFRRCNRDLQRRAEEGIDVWT